MEDVGFESNEKFAITDAGMYGIESIFVKKLAFPLGRDVIRGALVRDRGSDRSYFVTDDDLARYLRPVQTDLSG